MPVCQKADFTGPEELRQRQIENQKRKKKKEERREKERAFTAHPLLTKKKKLFLYPCSGPVWQACPAPRMLRYRISGDYDRSAFLLSVVCPASPGKTQLVSRDPSRPWRNSLSLLPVWWWAAQLGRCGWCRLQLGMAQ